MRRTGHRLSFVCRDCGHSAARWEGQCPRCQAWNTLEETVAPVRQPASPASGVLRVLGPTPEALELSSLHGSAPDRIKFGIGELDRVFGGGMVRGSVALLAGDPGIGKSTLLLQASALVAQGYGPVLYVSGEESAEQVRMRATRLNISGEGIILLAATGVADIIDHAARVRPVWIVIDSIQTMSVDSTTGGPGSVAQVRDSAAALAAHARASATPLVLAGHVTKDGAIAGPRLLEHMVDVVLQLEGDPGGAVRLLHTTKNRFGATSELGVFESRNNGLVEVDDPSRSFLSQRRASLPGSAVATVVEGTRPLTVEVQALTSPSPLPSPRRVATGVDQARLLMVIAVLARRLRLPLAGQDVVINVAGGLRVREPAADLAIAAAIASSLLDAPVAPAVAMAGEIGLGGELRAVPQDGRRAAEAARLGFETCLLPPATADCNGVRAPAGIRRVETLNEALAWLLPHTASAGPTPQALSGAAGRSRQQSGEDDEWLSTIEPPIDGNRADEDDLWRSRLEKTMRRQGRRNLP